MKFKIIIALLYFVISICNVKSQYILWEKEVDNEPIFQKYIHTKIIEDKSHNYICAMKEQYTRYLSTVKIDNSGNQVFLKNYYFPYSTAISYLSLTDQGNYYYINSAYHDTTKSGSAFPLKVPQVMITDTNGNVILERYNQGLLDKAIYDQFNRETYYDCLPMYFPYFIKKENNEFYIAFSRDKTEEDMVINHMIIKKYSSDCSLIWKKGYDSTNYFSFPNYYLLGFAEMPNNEMFAIASLYKISPKRINEYHFIKFDSSGSLKSRNKIPFSDTNFYYQQFIAMKDGRFALFGTLAKDVMQVNIYIFNKDGNAILNKIEFRDKYQNIIYKTLQLSDGSFIQVGSSKVSNGLIGMDVTDDTNEVYVRKFNKNLDLIWEKSSQRGLNDCWLDNVIETSDGNLAVSGHTNPYYSPWDKIYIAKIKDSTLNIVYPLISGDNSVCSGDTSIYFSTNDDHSTLLWKVEAGTLLSKQTDSTAKIRWDSLGKGRVAVFKKSIYTDRADTSSFVVNITQQPPKPTIARNKDTLISSSSDGNQWYRNGVLIPGAITSNYLPLDSGKYSVQVIKNGCLSLMSDEMIIEETGISDNDQNPGLVISPNPVSDFIEISYSALEMGSGGVDIRIYNIFGQNCDLTPALTV